VPESYPARRPCLWDSNYLTSQFKQPEGTMMNEFGELLRIVCGFLYENEIEHVVVGGIAVMYHGVPRTTTDIGLIVRMKNAEIGSFVGFLTSHGFHASIEDLTAALEENTHCTCFYRRSLLRLDIQGVVSDFDRMTLERAVRVNHLGTIVSLATAEDTLVNKVYFQGEQDLRDALGIYVRNRDKLDFSYVESTSKLLGIENKWKSFLRRATKQMKESTE
jgi:hypothetical protein